MSAYDRAIAAIKDAGPFHAFDCDSTVDYNYGTRSGKCDCTAAQTICDALFQGRKASWLDDHPSLPPIAVLYDDAWLRSFVEVALASMEYIRDMSRAGGLPMGGPEKTTVQALAKYMADASTLFPAAPEESAS